MLGFSQSAVAKALQVTRERLASYEHARAPVRYQFADSFCAVLYVNQHWLATGEGLVTPYVEKATGKELIPDRALFLDVYDASAKPRVLAETAAYWARVAPVKVITPADGPHVMINNPPRSRARAIIQLFVEDWLTNTPDEFLDHLLNMAWASGEEITRTILDEKTGMIMKSGAERSLKKTD